MGSWYRWCLLAVAIVVVVNMDTLSGLETADGVKLIKSNSVTTLADMKEMTPRHRSRRAATLSSAEKKLLVDKHNTLRRQEGASDMEHMKWSSYLASMAADWADGCQWKHGQPTRDPDTMPFNPVGQNLYLTSSDTIDLDRSIQAWYNEISDYTYSSRACSDVCGHYTQVVWAESREVGCAYTYCDHVYGSSISSGTYLVCNYGPAGNYPRHPFTRGDACTACGSGKGFCDNGLCRRDCTPSDNCECKVQCDHCGVADQNTCSCSCPKGWVGDYCTRECKDYSEKCGANPGWPLFWCVASRPYVLEDCPLFCGNCEAPDPGATCGKTTATSTTTTTTTTTTTPKPTTATTTTTPKPTTTTTTTTTTPKPTTTTTTTTTPKTTTTTKTTTTPTTTTTTPTATSTPTTTTVNLCAGVTCRNGGTASVQNGQCKCRCTADWQGTRCQESRVEAKFGVILKVGAPITIWYEIWGFIQPIIVRAINSYCNSHVSTCCPGANVLNSATYREYMTTAELQVGAGFPRSLLYGGYYYTLALIYAGGAPNNALCASARRRRAIDTASILQQDVVLSVVKNIQTNLTVEMTNCCNATLDAVSAAVLDDVTDDKGWGVAVTADVTVVVTMAAATISTMFWPTT